MKRYDIRFYVDREDVEWILRFNLDQYGRLTDKDPVDGSAPSAAAVNRAVRRHLESHGYGADDLGIGNCDGDDDRIDIAVDRWSSRYEGGS